MASNALHVTAEARPGFIRPLRDLVAEIAHDRGIPEGDLYAVRLCVSEAITNAVQHAYPDSDTGFVEVRVRDLGDELEIVVIDRGRGLREREPQLQNGQGRGLRLIEELSVRSAVVAAEGRGTAVEMVFP